MGFLKRKINLERNGNLIELIAEPDQQINRIVLALNINGIRQRTLLIDHLDRIIGYKHKLIGLMNENIRVEATIRSHFFMRPKYIIQVGDQVVHQQKGMWGGF